VSAGLPSRCAVGWEGEACRSGAGKWAETEGLWGLLLSDLAVRLRPHSVTFAPHLVAVFTLALSPAVARWAWCTDDRELSFPDSCLWLRSCPVFAQMESLCREQPASFWVASKFVSCSAVLGLHPLASSRTCVCQICPARGRWTGGLYRPRTRSWKEIEVGGGRKAIIIFVPVPQLKSFQKIQVRLVRELEKKFSGKHVVFIAQRRILPKPTRKSRTKNKQKRPRSRTLTAVHDAILEDLVFPSEIVGKRIRVKLDGSRLIKVHLDKAQQNNVEHKVRGGSLPEASDTDDGERQHNPSPCTIRTSGSKLSQLFFHLDLSPLPFGLYVRFYSGGCFENEASLPFILLGK